MSVETAIALGAVLVNIGINIGTLYAIKDSVRRLENTDLSQQDKLFNHDARIAVLESVIRMRQREREPGASHP